MREDKPTCVQHVDSPSDSYTELYTPRYKCQNLTPIKRPETYMRQGFSPSRILVLFSPTGFSRALTKGAVLI